MGYGERLREERLRLRMSQRDLAERCAVSNNSLVNYEGEKNSPAVSFFEAAALLGVDVGYVITGVRSLSGGVQEERPDYIQPSEREGRLITDFRAIGEPAKRAVEQVVSAFRGLAAR